MDRFGSIVAVAAGLVLMLVGTFMLAGCASTHPRERPFSTQWVNQQAVDAELKRREERINRSDELVLLGSSEEGGAFVSKDSKGDPKLNIGREGVRVDLDYSGGPKAGVRYEIDWDFARPDRGRARE